VAGTVANLYSRLNLDVVAPTSGEITRVKNMAKAITQLDTAYNKFGRTMSAQTVVGGIKQMNAFTRTSAAGFALATAEIERMRLEMAQARREAVQTGHAMAGAGQRVVQRTAGASAPRAGGGAGMGGSGGGGRRLGATRARAAGARGMQGGGRRLGATRARAAGARGVQGGGGGFRNIAGAFVGMLVGGALFRGMGVFVNKSKEMELALTQIRALTRATSMEMSGYEKQILRVASLTPFDPKEIAEAALSLRRLTGSSSAALATLRETASLSVASFGKLSLQQSAAFMGRMVATGGSAKVAKGRAAQLFGLGRALGVGIEDFAPVAGQLGAAAFRGQQDFLTTSSVFAVASQLQGSNRRAATQTFRLMSELGRGRAEEGLRRIGVSTRAGGKIRGIDQILGDIMDRMMGTGKFGGKGKLGTQAVMDALSSKTPAGVPIGERSIRPLVMAIQRFTQGVKIQGKGVLYGREALAALRDEAKQAKNIIDMIAEQRLQTLSGQIELMAEEMGKAARVVGDMFTPALKTVVTGLKGIAAGFQSLANNSVFGALFGMLTKVGVVGGSLFASVALLKGAKGLLTNVSQYIGVSKAAGWAGGLLAAAPMVNPYVGTYARPKSMRSGLGGQIGGFGPVGRGIGSGAGAAVWGATMGLGKFAAGLGIAYGAILAFEEVLSLATKGWKEYWADKRGGAAVEAARRGGGMAFEAFGVKGVKGLGRKDAMAFADAYQAKFGQNFGTEMTKFQKEWAGWRLKFHKEIMGSEVAKTTMQIQKQINLTARQVTLQKELNNTFQYGFEKMNKVLQETKALAAYEPPVIKWGTYRTATRMMQKAAVGGRLGSTEQRMAQTVVASSPEAEMLMEKAATGMATPREHARLMKLLQVRQAVLTHMGTMGVGGFTKGFAGKHGKGVLGQVAGIGTPQNLQYSNLLTLAAGGKYRGGHGSFVPGYNQNVAGLPGGPQEKSGDFGLFGSVLGMPFGRGGGTRIGGDLGPGPKAGLHFGGVAALVKQASPHPGPGPKAGIHYGGIAAMTAQASSAINAPQSRKAEIEKGVEADYTAMVEAGVGFVAGQQAKRMNQALEAALAHEKLASAMAEGIRRAGVLPVRNEGSGDPLTNDGRRPDGPGGTL